VAGDHQGTRPALLHHLGRIHSAHTVSFYSNFNNLSSKS
jgi:hypothetical protein